MPELTVRQRNVPDRHPDVTHGGAHRHRDVRVTVPPHTTNRRGVVMRLYLASTIAGASAVRRSGHTLTRAGRPMKVMPAFGPVADTCRCGADRSTTARTRPWRDCPRCTPVPS